MNLPKLFETKLLTLFLLLGIIVLLSIFVQSRYTFPPQKQYKLAISPIPSIQESTTLSSKDYSAKQKLLLKVLHGNYSGVVYESPRVRVEYIRSVDTFNAEIVTTNIVQTKQEVSLWLQSFGISQHGICNLPLIFHLGIGIEEQLGEAVNTFDPLPEGCYNR